MLERLGHEDPRGTGAAGDRAREHADRAGADHEHVVPRTDVRVLDGVDRDAQRLQQRAGVVAEALRQRDEELVGPEQAFLETAVEGLVAGEPHVRAEVAVPRAARLAPSARDRRVDRHPLAGVRPVQRHAGELVPRHHRLVEGDLAGAASAYQWRSEPHSPTEVTATVDQPAAGAGGVGLLHAEVAHGVEPRDTVHGPHHHRPCVETRSATVGRA